MTDQHASFRLVYDGPALAEHEMNVKDLAPALLAVGELLEEANRIVNGPKVKVVVNLKATETGCVDVLLHVSQSLIDQAISLFSSDSVTAIVNAKEILAMLGLDVASNYEGLINIILWQKNRPVRSVTKIDAGHHKIELVDGEYKQVTTTELNLFKQLTVRKRIETIVKTPLTKDGYDSLRFDKPETSPKITKEEADYFTAPDVPVERLGSPIMSVETLQLVSVVFQDGGKWRFSDGTSTFFADIRDDEFLSRIAKNEVAFAKDDLLEVELEKKQLLSGGLLKTEYSIIKVKNIRSAMVQIQFPLND